MKLSIVTGTLNRRAYLQKCISSIISSAKGLDYEIIIVDGGSMDGTLEWLRGERNIKVIEQGQVLGAVKAFNAGFKAARGEYVAAINDDAEYVGDTLVRAVKYLDGHSKAGQIAIPFEAPGGIPKTQILPAWASALIGKHNAVYANFSVMHKVLGDKVGWWGDWLYQYGGDTRLSLEVWLAGYEVHVLDGGSIVHHSLIDVTRKPNIESDSLRQNYDPSTAWRAGKGKLRGELTRLRYLGRFLAPATFANMPSGRVYKFALKPKTEVLVYTEDVMRFLKLGGDTGSAMFEETE